MNEENAKTKKMVDGAKDRHEGKLKLNEIELENEKIAVTETEACTVIATKDECNKEI